MNIFRIIDLVKSELGTLSSVRLSPDLHSGYIIEVSTLHKPRSSKEILIRSSFLVTGTDLLMREVDAQTKHLVMCRIEEIKLIIEKNP